MHKLKNKTQMYARASFNCDKEVLDTFRRTVVRKHGRLWGVLCKEFTEALKDRSKKLRKELAIANG